LLQSLEQDLRHSQRTVLRLLTIAKKNTTAIFT
jgi:hypothetical protein